MTEKYKYYYKCFNCGLDFSLTYKDDSIEYTTCPICLSDKQIPSNIDKVQSLNDKEN